MPPKSFPYPFKVGIDICRIPRIKSIISQPYATPQHQALPRFLCKLLTWPEQQFFWHRFGSHEKVMKDIDKVCEYLAGRWAAKEACRKACTHLGSTNGLHHIIILPISLTVQGEAHSRIPQGLILREVLPALGNGLAQPNGPSFDINSVEGQLCEVSITHDDGIAAAVALVPIMDTVDAKTEVRQSDVDP
ncbi:hypothetical protein P154DRAFT_462745 [Amniculicola lignicola CBS 123094]|uniref:4'-phosphopantetheinyl transferase domain-containing protein n=1 Tax=Amniculicola lignicola CBS 123094 TaxID=1392246 RepID=A0A6A5WX72_9PLEO|nr:hypothetical protein P154DRAFT_462745 [Amniculicola lignicola CBS 123094]